MRKLYVFFFFNSLKLGTEYDITMVTDYDHFDSANVGVELINCLTQRLSASSHIWPFEASFLSDWHPQAAGMPIAIIVQNALVAFLFELHPTADHTLTMSVWNCDLKSLTSRCLRFMLLSPLLTSWHDHGGLTTSTELTLN